MPRPYAVVLLVASLFAVGGCATAVAERIPIQADFGQKIVYGTNPSIPVERLRADCRQRGGRLDTCGSPCPPGAAVCAQVCAVTCESIRKDREGADAAEATDWLRYEADSFSLRYPVDAVVDREGPGLTRFRLIGPDAKPGTEMLDGFVLTIGPRTLPAGQDAEAFARAQLEQMRKIGEVLAPVTQTRFAGRTAFRYRTRTVGEATHLIVPLEERRVLSISWSISDREGRAAHEETIDRMLSSVRRASAEAAAPGGQSTETVPVALLDPGQTGQSRQRGCDTVVTVERPAPSADNRVEAALEALFAIDEERVDGLYNFIARTHETLRLERVQVVNSTARVYLSGRLTGLAGVCDDPRARIQIEETALRVSGVEEVAIFLNGRRTDLQPDARGQSK